MKYTSEGSVQPEMAEHEGALEMFDGDKLSFKVSTKVIRKM